MNTSDPDAAVLTAAPVRDTPRVRARVLVILFIASLMLGIGLLASFGLAGHPIPNPLAEALALSLPYVLMLGFLQFPLRRSGQSMAAVFGPWPSAAALRWSVATGGALLAISVGLLFVVFLPLSYAAPDFVKWWLIENPVTLIWREGRYVTAANVVNAIGICALAPVVEELVFRGLILPAWASRIGTRWALCLSAVFFSVLHAEIAGALVFGIVTGLVYLRTRMLWIPTVIHVTNNTIAWLLAAGDDILRIPRMDTLEAFQRSWWIGAAGLMAAPALWFLLRRMPQPSPVTP